MDEFQDLSLAQYEVITGLCAGHRHCFVVGDDEQSIYSWAGADPWILKRFRDDFGVTEVVLDRNRRCSRQIFEAARRVIALNPTMFEKRIEADQESEHCVVSYAFADEVEEAGWLLEDLWRDREATRLEWGEYALLYRAHVTGQYLETRCIEAGIPCRLAQGQSVRDDELIAFVVSSLQVIRSPDDPVAIEAFADQVLPRPLIEQVRARYRELRPGLRPPRLRPGRGPGRRGREQGVALHLPRGEPRRAGPHPRNARRRWWTSCSPSGSGSTAIRWRSGPPS